MSSQSLGPAENTPTNGSRAPLPLTPRSLCPVMQSRPAAPSSSALKSSSPSFAVFTTVDALPEPTVSELARAGLHVRPEAHEFSLDLESNAIHAVEVEARPPRGPLDQKTGERPQGGLDPGQSASTAILRDAQGRGSTAVGAISVVPSSPGPAPIPQPTPQSSVLESRPPASGVSVFTTAFVSVPSELAIQNVPVQQPNAPVEHPENEAEPLQSATLQNAGVPFPATVASTQMSHDVVSLTIPTTPPSSVIVQTDSHAKAISQETVGVPATSATTRPSPSIRTSAIQRHSDPARLAEPTTFAVAPQTTSVVMLAGGHHDSDQGGPGQSRGSSGAAGHDGGHVSYGGANPQTLMAAIIGGTLGAIAVVLFFVLVIWAWRKRRSAHRKRDSMDLYARSHRAEKKGCENDEMERGFANSKADKAELRDPLQWMWKPFSQLSRLWSRTVFATSTGVVRKRVFSRGQDTAIVNTSTDSGQGMVGRRRAASTLSGSDFRIGMDLNLSSDSQFNPFSAYEVEPARWQSKLDPPPVTQPCDVSPPAPLDSPPLPPRPAAPAGPLQRLRSQSLGVHHSFKAPDRTQPSPAGSKGDKFHSDPFDLEFHNRLQHVSGLARISQRCELTPSSSRYTFGPSAGFPHMDSFASRSISGISYHEWVKLEKDIRAAMIEDEDSSLGTVDSRYSGDRTVVHRGHGM